MSAAVVRPIFPFREPWWAWASDTVSCRWMQLLEYYTDPTQRTEWDIPVEFRELIDQVSALALPRTPINIATEVPLEISSRGMSPKKAHEVTQSVAYISNLLHSLGVDPHGVRIVDIGAGQGYLTRALQLHLGTRHLLALDSSGSPDPGNLSSQEEGEADPAPVLLVALHACGSLTPDILRTFFIQQDAPKDRRLWTPVGVIAVGCCYNLLAPQDFPISKRMSTSPPISLATSAYHMAAQIPAQWFRTPDSRADATLALRKVVWRAIIGARFAKTVKTTEQAESIKEDGTGDRPVMRRLGRLNNNVYTDWKTFAVVAGERIGVDLGPDNELDAEEKALISELEVLHVLRCIIGPLVESLIIMDREQWVQEHLDERRDGRYASRVSQSVRPVNRERAEYRVGSRPPPTNR
ncbi:Methyltranfer-dom domain-containing protein [Mycena venus]|uniref:Methyltranfer-dom domain-containing protein n=1 Tax=Mycena venus TaxID=2733690 RepID=A0A8H7D8P0_9AGAR|nr:Methyltranfer-dom domain-containing protein [Mycena venus]